MGNSGSINDARQAPSNVFAIPGEGENVVVRTSKGAVKGFRKGRASFFRGVPVAASTAGSNRWKEPQPRAPWDGLLDCTEYGDACFQNPDTGLYKLLGKGGTKIGGDIGKMGDDVLHINITAPSHTTKGAPVLVWVHGGANKMGSNKGDAGGFVPTHTDSWAGKGAVVCSLSYRVGLHGFLHLPDEGVTNLALRDLLNGLRWVRDEIASFGGDPNNVTLFGQSSGAINICHLASSPLAQSLFSRVIIQSGGPMGNVTADEYKTYDFPDFAAALLPFLHKHGHDTVTVATLETLSGEEIYLASTKVRKSLEKKQGKAQCPDPFHIYVGDDVMPRHPIDMARSGVAKNKQIIMGFTAMEGQFLVNMMGKFLIGYLLQYKAAPTFLRGCLGIKKSDEATLPAGCVAAAQRLLVEGHQQLHDKSHELHGRTGKTWTGAASTDGMMQAFQQMWAHCPGTHGAWVQAMAGHSSNSVHTYCLDTSKAINPSGNWHGLDLMLLFRPTDQREAAYVDGAFLRPGGDRGKELERIGDGMLRCWLEFAANGQPGTFNGTVWPPYPQHLTISSSPVVGISPFSPKSDSYLIWTKTMAQCGIDPSQDGHFQIPNSTGGRMPRNGTLGEVAEKAAGATKESM